MVNLSHLFISSRNLQTKPIARTLNHGAGLINYLNLQMISVEDRLSFSGYFSNNRDLISMGITRCTLLPLIDEEIATPATIRHCMRIVKRITEKLSAGQSPVITGDQSVYTLGRQMQWMYPDEFKMLFG